MCEFPQKITIILFIYMVAVYSAQQLTPEINDQFEKLNHTEVNEVEEKDNQHLETNTDIPIPDIEKAVVNKTEILDSVLVKQEKKGPGSFTKFYVLITAPINRFLAVPKVNAVLKNIGTCLVNGAMEIVTYYFPAPIIPLIASAAGMIMPFEPVVTLRRRMPVTSYRRAFSAAVNSFMGIFDRFKHTEGDDDPYMTRRFNRRFGGGSFNSSEFNS